MHLVGTRSFSSGAVLLTYEPGEELPSSPYVDEFRWTREQIRSLHAAQDTDRVLATILFTDIVGSTERAAALGDRAWRQLLDHHDQVARAEVGRWHGDFVKTTGDGILATFDAPTRALRCAFGLREALADLGLEIRAAIHTGEIEMRDGDIGGIGIHIASRALEEATDHSVVVTRTVRDLATGTDLSFSPLGSVGLESSWPSPNWLQAAAARKRTNTRDILAIRIFGLVRVRKLNVATEGPNRCARLHRMTWVAVCWVKFSGGCA